MAATPDPCRDKCIFMPLCTGPAILAGHGRPLSGGLSISARRSISGGRFNRRLGGALRISRRMGRSAGQRAGGGRSSALSAGGGGSGARTTGRVFAFRAGRPRIGKRAPRRRERGFVGTAAGHGDVNAARGHAPCERSLASPVRARASAARLNGCARWRSTGAACWFARAARREQVAVREDGCSADRRARSRTPRKALAPDASRPA